MDKRLLPLALGGLAIGTTEFGIMGLLTDISQSLSVSIPKAGHFISAYALGVVIGAPLLIGTTKKFPPKKVLMFLMAIYAVFNSFSIFANSYTFMLTSRFLSGLPHGAFFGVGTVVAVAMAKEGKAARNISFMFSGLTIANLAMVPLMTYIGHQFSWRYYFAILTFMSLLTILLVQLLLPDIQDENSKSAEKQPNILVEKNVWIVLLVTSIGFGGLFAWLSYIDPLMTIVSGFKVTYMPYVMIVIGFGMVVGNIVGGRMADKIGPKTSTLILLAVMCVNLLLTFQFSGNSNISILLCFLSGTFSMALISPINIMILHAAPKSQMMATALIQAAFNIANALGAYLGSLPLENHRPYNYPSLIGAAMSIGGLLFCLFYKSKKLV
ncbi:MFS transporter [Rhizosphaericola mali]|uniref:MFS transporter n=1 Tax=Rhizosphaericola mali TaxID=2545455 RepID=A0A5P2FY34_9BACT|nr:MFS transporter [Rhizosphaericola mali]QES88454.1 MFS transporter [Rhizosphaericola mali]